MLYPWDITDRGTLEMLPVISQNVTRFLHHKVQAFCFVFLVTIISSQLGNTLESCEYPASYQNFHLDLASVEDSCLV